MSTEYKIDTRTGLVSSEIERISTRCAFCWARIEVPHRRGRMVKPRYYCGEACSEDYRILQTPYHPMHDEVRMRRERLAGRR